MWKTPYLVLLGMHTPRQLDTLAIKNMESKNVNTVEIAEALVRLVKA